MLVIIQGVFRSGTTALFEVLRQDKRFRCYYEPLHPDLLVRIRDAQNADPEHPKAEYFAEYGKHRARIEKLFRPRFASDDCILNASSDAPELETYLRFLVGTHENVILQFNRAFWCASWLKKIFSNAHFIHIIRDPRSVVWSQMTTGFPNGRRVALDIPLLCRRGTPNLKCLFSRFASCSSYHVQEYFELGAKKLNESQRATFKKLKDKPSYVRALAVWGAQVAICHQEAHNTFRERYRLLRYELFCERPIEELSTLYAFLDLAIHDEIEIYAETHVHMTRLQPWTECLGAYEKFAKGMEMTNITDFVRSLGYS